MTSLSYDFAARALSLLFWWQRLAEINNSERTTPSVEHVPSTSAPGSLRPSSRQVTLSTKKNYHRRNIHVRSYWVLCDTMTSHEIQQFGISAKSRTFETAFQIVKWTLSWKENATHGIHTLVCAFAFVAHSLKCHLNSQGFHRYRTSMSMEIWCSGDVAPYISQVNS